MPVIRTFYLLIPSILTLVSLILVLLVFLDQLSRTSSVLNSLFFLKVHTGAFTLADRVGIDIADWYTIGLWNYCSGSSGSSTPTFCSTPKAYFYFNPLQVWGLESLQGTIDELAPSEWKSGLDTYEAVSKWMFIAYIVSLATLAATTLFGACVFCMSRASSCCVTLLALVSALFTIAASATATALFLTIEGLLKEKLGKYGVTSDIGSKILGFSWAAAGIALVASFAWLLSCCCSGERRERRKNRHHGSKQYFPVPSPYASQTPYTQSAMPLQATPKHNTSYEPYRTTV